MLVIAVALVALVCGCEGCGMTTHNVIANRARQWFLDAGWVLNATSLLNTHIDALQGGAPYPDYLYECGTDHNAGEATHWPPFQAAAATYIHSVYPQPWDQHTEKLIVFMLGVTSHYIADINWHGLAQVPFGQGFLRTMGSQNYNCSGQLCDTAHTEGDTGGEFVAAYQTNLSFYEPARWYIPTKDLVKIYTYAPQFVNITVEASWIDDCSAIFFTGSEAIKAFGADLYGLEVAPAPFLGEQYIDFFLGGVDDMAAWSAFMWNRMLSWVIDPPTNPLPPMESAPSDDGNADRAPSRISPGFRALIRKLKQLFKDHPELRSIIRRVETERGHYLEVNKDESALTGSNLRLLGNALLEVLTTRPAFLALSERTKQRLTAAAAKAIEFRAEEIEATLQGVAPINEDENTATAPSLAQLNLEGSQSNEYFGQAFCTGDVNGDSIDDIVVGSPGIGTYGDPQRGHVSIFFGAPNANVTLNSTADVVLTGVDVYGRFGTTCTILDFNLDGNLDLAVSAPSTGGKNLVAVTGNYTGVVHVYLGTGKPLSPFQSTPSISIESPMNYASLGFAMTSGDIDGHGQSSLILGSPYASTNNADVNNVQVGAVAIFRSSTARVPGTLSVTDADIQLEGESSFSMFGFTLLVVPAQAPSSPILIISAPIVNNVNGSVGRVYAYTCQQSSATLVANITGVSDKAKFGWALATGAVSIAGSLQQVVAISASSFGNPYLHETEYAWEGRVYVFALEDLLNGATLLTQVQALAILTGDADFAHVGWQLHMADLNADGSDDLLLSLPLLNHETGAVRAYLDGGVGSLTWALEGYEMRARFGARINTLDFDGDGLIDLLVSLPRLTSPAATMYGQVQVTFNIGAL
eukprot:m.738714 g.738714  ORF g.738714 m.738714 type:complete len:865 (+) comp58911_c0_seq1:2-2596(+)